MNYNQIIMNSLGDIVDMLLTVQHHLPCMSRYSTMPLTVTIFKFLNVINLFQCDASNILKQILTFAEWDSFCFKTFEASLYYNTKSRCTEQKQSQTASSGQMFLRYPTYILVTKPPQKWHCAKQRYIKTPNTNLKYSTNQPSWITWSCDNDWS